MKILGAILIIFASIIACVLYEKSEKEKIANASKICDFIKHIKAQIEYFSTPVDKIFNSYELKDSLIEAIISNNINDISHLISKDDFNTSSDFFNSLGKGLKKEELSVCAYTIETLEKSIEKKTADYPSKTRVFRAMALFCGFCIIIMLI